MLQEMEPAADSGRLRKCVEEIAFAARSDIPPEQFFRKLVGVVVPAIRARGTAIWFPSGNEFQCAGASGMEETDYANDPRQRTAISNAIRETADTRLPVLVGPGNAEGVQPNGKHLNFKPFPFIYVPAVSGEASGEVTLQAVLQVWLPTGFDPRGYNDVAGFMKAMARETAVFMRARRVETLAAGNAKMQKMLQFLTEVSGQYDVKRLGTVLVNWTREITGCDRCAFFIANPAGKLSPVAVSSVDVVNPKSALVQLQLKLAQGALDSMAPMLYQKSAPKTDMQGDISDYFVLSHATDALAVPLLGDDKQKYGVLLVESQKDRALDKDAQGTAIVVAKRSVQPVAAALEIQRLPMLKGMQKLAGYRRSLTATHPGKFFFKYGIPLAIVVLAACYPMRLMIRSDCLLVPKVRGVAVAEVGGRVKQIFIHEGDAVVAGQPIAKVDDDDLQQNLRISQEEQQRYQIEANRAEATGDQASKQIALVEVARSGRQVDLYKTEIFRTTIKSPIAGIVLTKDIEMMSGAVVPPGTRFCEIGDFQSWELISKVPEGEVGLLETKLRQGPVKMQFVLNSAPGHQIDAVIANEQSISPVSNAVPGANIFLVHADFVQTPGDARQLEVGLQRTQQDPARPAARAVSCLAEVHQLPARQVVLLTHWTQHGRGNRISAQGV